MELSLYLSQNKKHGIRKRSKKIGRQHQKKDAPDQNENPYTKGIQDRC